jgi:hypothetical protein
MRRLSMLLAALCVVPSSLWAEVVTLPAAASIVGANPFFSDVRVFNTSYASGLDVTGTYRCFIATVACPGVAPQIHFSLAPRESRLFDDIAAGAFGAPDTAGGVEFEFLGASGQLVVTSRLFSTFPEDSVGMFIPGLDATKAHGLTVLTSIRHDPNTVPPTGFRTNVGIFNPGSSSVDVTFTVFNAGSQVGTPVTRTVAGHSGVQVSSFFEAAGLASLSTQNATIVVSASGSIFSYAAVLDNRTADPIFVVGAHDQPSQVIPPADQTVRVGHGGTFFVDDQSGTSITTVTVGGKVTWVWEGALNHSTTSGTCSGGGPYGDPTCDSSGVWGSGMHPIPYSYSYTFNPAGSFPYFCSVHQSSMTGRVIVNTPAAPASPAKR